MFQQILEKRKKEKTGSGKAIVLVGARQVGKTTLINKDNFREFVKPGTPER